MENKYVAENDIKIEIPKFPKYSKSILEGKILEIKNGSITRVDYSNEAVYEIDNSLLTLPNGEKFNGVLSDDYRRLKKGKYIWPNNQEYIGSFDEQNRFSSNKGEISILIFSNGDKYEGEFKEGKIGRGTYKTEGKEISADFTGGKINGAINLNDTIKGIEFKGYLLNGKKEDICKTKIIIKNKTFYIKGSYTEGKKDGTFIIREIFPIKDNLYIKGRYKEGSRDGFFDIIDKEKGIKITHQYISSLQTRLINSYNEKYKENINGKEVNISITNRDNPIYQLYHLVSIRFAKLLTLDLTRANIDSIYFLNSEENTLFSLQNLILSYNNITDISPLISVDYKKLKTLIANDNKIKQIECIQEFNFNELEELNLSSNPIESIEGIENWNFPNLFELSFYRTNISDVSPLYNADFPNLTQLDLYFTKIKKNTKLKPEMFKKCKNLKNIIFDRHF